MAKPDPHHLEEWSKTQTWSPTSPSGSLARGVIALLDHAWTSLGLNSPIPTGIVAETNEVGDVRVTIRIKKDRHP